MPDGSPEARKKLAQSLCLENALSGKLEPFVPLAPPEVGLYVCGPTVYSEVHIGNIRTFVCFDVLKRFLTHVGYQVCYVRNITDVGHLVDEGQHETEDKIEQAARKAARAPEALSEHYTRLFHEAMHAFGVQSPDIEPRATAHIGEQIALINRIMDNGYAYAAEGSVYFDLSLYEKKHRYGLLSGRKTQELYAQTRDLAGGEQKRSPLDFALWKRAEKGRLMQWEAPWSQGFPGWHLECSAMSHKYLGQVFDIHAGGMDLKFPHHECELAQSTAAFGASPARYWMYANMLTVDKEKMSKSAGNVLGYHDLITGQHPLLAKAYPPMVLRFFMLQTHYGSPLDISATAIQAAERGYLRLCNGYKVLGELEMPKDLKAESVDADHVAEIMQCCMACEQAMCRDLNTAIALGELFKLLRKVNALATGQLTLEQLGAEAFYRLKNTYITYFKDVLGLELPAPPQGVVLIESLLAVYRRAKAMQSYEVVDQIRADLRRQGIAIQDLSVGNIRWSYME